MKKYSSIADLKLGKFEVIEEGEIIYLEEEYVVSEVTENAITFTLEICYQDKPQRVYEL